MPQEGEMIANLIKSGSINEETSSNRQDIVMMTSSVRVPVTAENRAYLRAIRQAELDAWQNAPGGTVCVSGRHQDT
jgi:hypothetical protein